jgi:hypothetical protein
MDKKNRGEMVDVFIGIKPIYGADGKQILKQTHGRISKATADTIGVRTDFIRTGKEGGTVTIKKGSAKGASYKKNIRGSRGDTYGLVYPVAKPAVGQPKTKTYSIGVPAGTPGRTFLNFVRRGISKPPDSIIYPSGKTHRFTAATR